MSSRQVLRLLLKHQISSLFILFHSTNSTIYPLGIFAFAQRLAPCHRIQSFPAFVQERSQILFRLLGAIMRLAQQSCRTTGTEFPLTRTHADTCAAAQVYQVVHIKLVHRIVDLAHCNIFTLANQTIIILACLLYTSPSPRD